MGVDFFGNLCYNGKSGFFVFLKSIRQRKGVMKMQKNPSDVSVQQKTEEIPSNVARYWEKVRHTVNLAGELAQARGLRDSLDERRKPESKFENLLDHYYGGSRERLDQKIGELKDLMHTEICALNRLCEIHEISSVREWEVLAERLASSPERRRLYRRFADKHKKSWEIFPVSELEEEYKDWKVARFSKK